MAIIIIIIIMYHSPGFLVSFSLEVPLVWDIHLEVMTSIKMNMIGDGFGNLLGGYHGDYHDQCQD